MSPASSVKAGRWVAMSMVWVSAGRRSVPPGPATGSSGRYELSSKTPAGQVPPAAVTDGGFWPQAYRGSVGAVLVPTSANAVKVNAGGTAASWAGAVVKCASPLTVPSESRTR
jgi:hypothetical protein